MPSQPNASILDPRAFLEGYPGLISGNMKFGMLEPKNCVSDAAVLTTQVMSSAPIFLEPGDVVTSITFASGNTPAGTPTNWWFALYSDAAVAALLAQSADQGAGAWAANTPKTLALSSPQAISRAGIYYAACMVKATTPPTLVGATLLNAVYGGALGLGLKVQSQTSGSGLTTTAPATIASPTTIAAIPFFVAS